LVEVRRREVDIDTKLQVLDDVVSRMGTEGPGLVRSLTEQTQRAEELRSSVRSHQSLARELDQSIEDLKRQMESAQLRNERLTEESKRLEVALITERKRTDLQQKRIEELTDKITTYEDPDAESDRQDERTLLWKWAGIGLGSALAVLATCGSLAALLRWKKRRSELETDSEERTEGTNNG
jgi:chromosome segregation ATPase